MADFAARFFHPATSNHVRAESTVCDSHPGRRPGGGRAGVGHGPAVRLTGRRRDVRQLPVLQPIRVLRQHLRLLCGAACQSQCSGCGSTGGGVASIVSRDLFEQMLLHRNDGACQARGFYTYDAFVAAAKAFPAFGTTGSTETRKREVAAFFGQTSHETTGGWPTAPDGPFAWGYCFKQEQGSPGSYCQQSSEWPCAPGKKYYGRGPIQLSWNYNYGPAGRAIGVDLLNNPDQVATDPTVSFKTALWFWMTAQANKPSCHAVVTGQWRPSGSDNAAGRKPGYGVITNIINGGLECGKGQDPRVANRIGFYKRYCDILGVGYGSNLDCYNQRPFSSGLSAWLAELSAWLAAQ